MSDAYNNDEQHTKIRFRQQSISDKIVCYVVSLSLYARERPCLFFSRLLHRLQNAAESASQKDDRVSVIIATYNRSAILVERTIPSVLSQDYANIEIVIVGDRCIDDTADKVRSILDKRVKFYDLPRRGKYPSHIENRWFVQGSVPRNAGMKIATGKWFVFLSDDDILYPNHVSTLIKAAKSQNLEFVSAAYETVKDGERITVGPRKLNVGSELVCGGMQTWLYRSYLRCFRWNRHSWRKAFDRPVDYDLQQRLFEAGVRMGNISDVVYFNPPVEGTNTTGYAAALEVASKRS